MSSNPNSLHSINLLQNLWVQFYNIVMLTMLLTDLPFQVFYIPFYTYFKNIYNHVFANHIHFVLITNINICAFDKKCVQKFQHDFQHQCFPVHQIQIDKPFLRSPFLLFTHVLPILHPFNMFIIVLLCLYPHKLVRIQNANTFVQKYGFIHYGCTSFCLYSAWCIHIDLHCPLLHFC